MYYENKKEKQRKNIMAIFFMVIIIALLASLNLRLQLINENNIQNDYSTQRLENVEKANQETKGEYDFIEEASQAIVGISKLKSIDKSLLGVKNEVIGQGSGVIITDNGYILTNQHLVGNKYSTCYVTLANGKNFDGSVIWSDENIDLSIVKVPGAALKHLELGDTENIKLGEDVYAIGNPIGFEFQRTVTKGIISGLNRTIKIEENGKFSYMEDLIQTDSTINTGNSGGALINKKGELLGINTIKISDAEGIGFAVPISIIKPIIDKLVNSGKFEEAYLGIYGYDKEVIPYLEGNIELDSGIYVDSVSMDGPVYNSGIISGDIITKIDGQELNKMSDLRKYIYSKRQKEVMTNYASSFVAENPGLMPNDESNAIENNENKDSHIKIDD